MIPFGFQLLGNGDGMVLMYVLLFLAATVRTFFDPAWESVLPEIASEEELTSANSFLSISSFGSTAIGFALAGLLAGIDIHLPFFIDAGTFAVSFLFVLAVRIPAHAAEEESTTIGVIVENLKVGAQYLWRTRLLRWLFVINLPIMLSFGLWNVLLLPMAIRELNASEFEYGLQEGVTSVGFVLGSLLMARFGDRLPEGTWMVSGTVLMGVFGIAYGLAPNIQIAIVLVMITGFLNSPMSIARRGLMQKNIPRAMRGRVFSAFAVSRDVVFLIGMSGAALADIYPVRVLIIVAGLLLLGAGIVAQLAPGIGRTGSEWRRALQLLAMAPAAARVGAGRAATMMDFDRLLGVMPEIGAVSMNRRAGFLTDLTVARAAPGEAIVKAGDPGDAAFFILGGKVVAGIPDADGYRALSTMGPGDFFGEIAALTGSARTANVVADEETDLLEMPKASLQELLELPPLNELINAKLNERLGRTSTTDIPRLSRPDQDALRDLRRRRPSGTAGTRA
jgi:MFS family permease